MDQDGTWHGGGLGPGHIVLDGDSAPLPKKGTESPSLIFGPFYSGQMVGCIKLSLGMEVGLGPDDIVLDGDPAPPAQKGGGAPSPIFGRCLLWPNGWIDQDGTLRGGVAWSRPHCARWGYPAPLSKKGAEPPIFGPIAIVAKGLDVSRCHLVRR